MYSLVCLCFMAHVLCATMVEGEGLSMTTVDSGCAVNFGGINAGEVTIWWLSVITLGTGCSSLK